MKYARVVQPSSAKGYSLILPHEFNAAVHKKGDVLCADPSCSAQMFYRDKAWVNGASYERGAHFSSYHVHDHTEGCLAVMRDQSSKTAIGMLDAILNPNAVVLFNLNFNTGHSDFGKLGLEAIEHRPTPYNLFLDKHKHASVPIHSLSELFKLRNRIENVDPNALQRVTLGHCQNIISLDNAVISSAHDVRELYRRIYVDRKSGLTRSHMPMIFDFEPLAKSKQNSGTYLYGRGVNVHGKKGGNYTIQHVLDFGELTYLKTMFQEQGRSQIIAVPDINYREAKATAEYAEKHPQSSNKSTFRLYWHVLDMAQQHKDNDETVIQSTIFGTNPAVA